MANHKHRMTRESGPYCFTGPVAEGPRQNPAAHGNVRFVQHCRCGAVQDVLVNGRHVERSGWYTPAEQG